MHCDTNAAEAYFGAGTRLTVLGKKSHRSKLIFMMLERFSEASMTPKQSRLY